MESDTPLPAIVAALALEERWKTESDSFTREEQTAVQVNCLKMRYWLRWCVEEIERLQEEIEGLNRQANAMAGRCNEASALARENTKMKEKEKEDFARGEEVTTREKAKTAYSKCGFKPVGEQTPWEIAGFYLSAWNDSRLKAFAKKIRIVAEIIEKALEEEKESR